MLTVQLESALPSADLDALRAGMRRHIELHVPFETYEDITVSLRDEEQNFHGAAVGEAGRGWLHVSIIWVTERYRRLGCGTQLLDALESEAVSRGCHHAYLDTFSYQAPAFYRRNGYTVFGQLDDYPRGHTRYFMSKELPQRA